MDQTKVKIELETESWFAIMAIMHISMEKIAQNMIHNPLAYSRAARAFNTLQEQFLKNVTLDQVDEYAAQMKKDKEDLSYP